MSWGGGDRQRVGSEAIGPRAPLLAPPDDQYDNPDQRDEGEQEEPAAAVGVMQSARRNCQVRQQQGEASQAAERRHYRSRERNVIDDSCHDLDDQVEKDPIPEL